MSATADGQFRASCHRTPAILQMEAVECGAAALAIVLAYYGRWVSLEQLRVDCGVTRDGSRASNMAKAARAYGLVSRGRRVETADLAAIALPVIAFWNFNHFVVVEGANRRGVWINDPSVGRRHVLWAEFDQAFTGVVLTATPGPDFTRGGEEPSLVHGLASRLRGARGALAVCLLAGLGLIVPGLALPALLDVFVDEYLTPANQHGNGVIVALIAGLLLAAVVSWALTWLQQATLVRLAAKLSLSMSSRFIEHLLRLPIPFFQQRYAGTLVTRLNVNDDVASFLSSQFTMAMLKVVTVAFYAVLMFWYSPVLGGITVAFALVNLVVLHVDSRRRESATRRVVLDTGKMASTAIGGVRNIEAIKATGEEGGVFARWAGYQAKVSNTNQEIGVSVAVVGTVPVVLAMLNVVFVLGFGGWQVVDGALTLGALAAFQSLSINFNAPIEQLVELSHTTEQLAGKLASVDDVLNHPEDDMLATVVGGGPAGDWPDGAGPDGGARDDGSPVGGDGPAGGDGRRPARGRRKLSGLLELREVTFGYDPFAPPLLRDLDLVVRPGRRVAVVGPSGSGKSTIAKLVCGLYKPWSGEVRFDGVRREEVPPDIMAASIGFVDQDVVLFAATVRDNLTLWDPTTSNAALVAATRDAAIHTDVVRRPGGLDRMVQEGGGDWSGGQRQRLEIARALAGNPSLVVLDEATSALDPVVEEEIDRNIRARGCSCLIVAHRLSTIRDADEIIVMDSGTVAQRGTHAELLAEGGLYAALVGE
ncbi:MAG TPA: NHLP family bacteriocin export ABC transporter peptidase/permease/ATPase subunit [Acidimicrobiales bacterium]|nr:NHLP family bacteriocin export ABC transporter peptidase/permease/ATPase subunit [Acidimicrobiales bacterium]